MGGNDFNYCDTDLCLVAVCTANQTATQKNCSFNPDTKEEYEKRCIHCRTNIKQTGTNGKSYFHCDNYDAQIDARKSSTKHPEKEKIKEEIPKKEEKKVKQHTKRSNKRKQKKRAKSKPIKSQSDIIQERLKKFANK